MAHSTTRALFASYNGPLYQATGPGSVNAAHAVRTVGHCPTGRTPGVCRRLTLTSTPL
ncbi:arabinofuranosidase catalytic domain-containing protein [Streptomyces sp. NBC_01530]|uniref:arabinofuranosidase catalytic domain-containing protein n=1 Tax=Streptomyces sp. NBC_01530 TaxID=2903895 RepID=UPI003864C0A2